MVYLSLWCTLAVIGGLIGYFVNGRVGSGILLGMLFGPLGWLIVFFLDDTRRRCPACHGIVPAEAAVCLHCRGSLAAVEIPSRSEEEPFCMKCGVDGLSAMELGQPVSHCPKCGARL